MRMRIYDDATRNINVDPTYSIKGCVNSHHGQRRSGRGIRATFTSNMGNPAQNVTAQIVALPQHSSFRVVLPQSSIEIVGQVT